MKRSLLVAVAIAVPVLVSAQSDRIPIRVAPTPNQTAHGTMVFDMAFNLTIDGAPPNVPAPPGPMALAMKMTMAHSLAVGARDDDGNVSAHLTIDDATYTVSMNGTTMPAPNPSAAWKSIDATFVFDSNGTVSSLSTPSDSPVPAPVRQAIESMMQSLPVGTLAVGESMTVPLALNIPLPMAAGGISTTGRTTITLTSVSNEVGQRIAHYTSESSGRFSGDGASPLGGAGAANTVDMQFTMSGTTDVNLDRGLIQAGNQHGTIEADFHSSGNAAMRIHVAGPITIEQRTTF